MKLTSSTFRRRIGAFAILTVPFLLSACSEKLDSTAACPEACSDETLEIFNDTLDVVTIDTAVSSSFGLGADLSMLLASIDTLVDTRVILRFDSLPRRVRVANNDTITNPVTFVDSVFLNFMLDRSAEDHDVPVTVEVYDVNGVANDTSVEQLKAMFEDPDRLVASRVYDPFTLIDTIRIALPRDWVEPRVTGGAPIRLGVRLVSSKPVSTRMFSSATGDETIRTYPYLRMRISPDFAIAPAEVPVYSKTPTGNLSLSRNLADFVLLVKTPAPASADYLAVGGIPGRRTYFRVNIPQRYFDSTIVIRATLLLHQYGEPVSPYAADSMQIFGRIGLATAQVTSVERAAQITVQAPETYPYFLPGLDTLRLEPGETREVAIEIAKASRLWQAQPDSLLPRAIVLEDVQEDGAVPRVLFHSSRDPNPALRPKLRISYSLRTRVGVP